jgi:hypothetical protein
MVLSIFTNLYCKFITSKYLLIGSSRISIHNTYLNTQFFKATLHLNAFARIYETKNEHKLWYEGGVGDTHEGSPKQPGKTRLLS